MTRHDGDSSPSSVEVTSQDLSDLPAPTGYDDAQSPV